MKFGWWKQIVLGFFCLAVIANISLALYYLGGFGFEQNKQSEKLDLVDFGRKSVVLAKNEMSDGGGEEGVGIKVSSADARPVIIERYLAKYKSPLLPYSSLIYDLSLAYGFDYYWIVAIAQQESNLCKKIPENSYNCWGYGIHKAGTLRFESYELALRSFAEYLKREYFDKGLNTPETIMKKYCPHSNGSWAFGVNQFIEEMESGRVGNGV